MTADTSFSLLPGPIREALESRGYTALTAVQQAVTDPALAGKNLRISSQTGSGKTVAIGIVLAPLLEGKLDGKPKVLLITPTRELASQVRDELAWLYAGITERVVVVTGGTSVSGELRALNQGADIVVGTPGRMLDHVRRGAIHAASVKAVVLDEADQMLDLGFKEELEGILDALPPERMTHMVSATFPREVLALAHRYQSEAVHVQGTRLGAANIDISHVAHLVHATERLDALVNVLLLDPQALSLVFTRTRADAAEVADELGSLGFSAAPLTGEMEQRARTRTLDAFRRGNVRVLVATDVAARGIDVQDIARVIHYDAAEQAEVYTHRSGRTGRAGQKGQSILFVMPRSRMRITQLLRIAKVDVRWEPVPSADDVKKASEERLRASLQTDDETTAQLDPGLRSLASSLLDERDAFTIIVRLLARIGTGGPCEPRAITPINARSDSRDPRDARDTRGRDDRSGRNDGRSDRGDRGERPAYRADDRRPVGGEGPPPRRKDEDGRSFVAYEINMGERDGAEARRIMAIACRKGGVKGSDVGLIQIGFRSSIFEIDARVADAFTKAISEPDPRDPRTQIRPSEQGPSREPRERRTVPPPGRGQRPSYPSAPWEDDDGSAPRVARPQPRPPVAESPVAPPKASPSSGSARAPAEASREAPRAASPSGSTRAHAEATREAPRAASPSGSTRTHADTPGAAASSGSTRTAAETPRPPAARASTRAALDMSDVTPTPPAAEPSSSTKRRPYPRPEGMDAPQSGGRGFDRETPARAEPDAETRPVRVGPATDARPSRSRDDGARPGSTTGTDPEARPRRERPSSDRGMERPYPAPPRADTSVSDRPRRERPADARPSPSTSVTSASDRPRRERPGTGAGGARPYPDRRPARVEPPRGDSPPRRSGPHVEPPPAPPATARRRVVTTVDAPPPRAKPVKKRPKD